MSEHLVRDKVLLSKSPGTVRDGPINRPQDPRPPTRHREPEPVRGGVGRCRTRGRGAVPPPRVRPRVSRRRLRRHADRDAGCFGLPADVRPRQGQRPRGRNSYPGQDRLVPRIHPQPYGGEARGLGHCGVRTPLVGIEGGAGAPACAGPRATLRPGLRGGRHVSGPDSDPRHSRLSPPPAPRHAPHHPPLATIGNAFTVLFYLPRDASATHVGTIFHERLPDGSMPKHTQMKFAPNTGYAFAVGEDTWHSADPVGPEVTTRDSILLTYFVDSGLVRYLRNRGKRVGNFLLNEARNRFRR